MKNILILILVCISTFLNGQTVYSSFGGYGNVSGVTGTGPSVTLTVQNFVGNSRFEPDGQYLASDVQVGDVLWVNCTRWPITVINSTSGTTMNVTLTAPASDWAIGISTPSNSQRVAVIREGQGTTPSLPQTGDGNNGPVSGITSDLYTCMFNHYQQALFNNSNPLNEIAFTTGTTPPANSVATVDGYKLAKNNMGNGDLYQWDGTAWVLNNTSGSGLNTPDSTFKKVGRSDFWQKNSTSPVYREGKITIGSSLATDTAAVLNIVGSNELSNQFGIHIRGDATNIIKISGDSRATTPIAKTDFNFGRSFYSSVSPAGDNQVYNGGINYTAGGGHEERYQSAIGWALESNYKNSPSELGDAGYGFYEAQWPEVVYSDSTKGSDNIIRPTGVTHGSKRRAIAGYFSNQKPSNGGYLGFCSDINYYVDWKTNTSRATWGFADGTTKGIVFNDTARVQFNTNNVGGIIMADNVGGGRNMLKMDNLNRLVLYEGGSGGTIYTPANRIETQNALTLVAGSGQDITIGSTATTSGVSINAISVVPLSIRSSLNASGYGFLADNFSFGLRDLSTNRNVLIYDKGSQDASIWIRQNGHVGLGGYPDFDALFHINKATITPNFAIQRFTNTTGSTTIYKRSDTPEGTQAANVGDICYSGNGNQYIKKTGTGNTGWENVLTSSNATKVGTFNNTGTAKGLSIDIDSIELHAATFTNPGGVNTGSQTFNSGGGSLTKNFSSSNSGAVSNPITITNGSLADGTGVKLKFDHSEDTKFEILSENPVGAFLSRTAFRHSNNTTLIDYVEMFGSSTHEAIKFNVATEHAITNLTGTTEQITGLKSYVNIPSTATTTTINLPEIVTGVPSANQCRIGYELYLVIDRSVVVTVNRSGTDDLIFADDVIGSDTSFTSTAGTFFAKKLVAIEGNKWVVFQ